MLSLPLQSLVGNSHVRKVRRLAAAVCVGCLVLSGCSSGGAEAEGVGESTSGSPFAEPEDPTPKIPEYTVEEGLELSDDDKQLADEAVVFFTEYMAAANRAYKDGGVYWDRFNSMTAGELKEAQEASEKKFSEEGRIAKNDLKASELTIGNFEASGPEVFLTACMHYKDWETTSTNGERVAKQDVNSVSGFVIQRPGDEWRVVEITNVDQQCD